MKQQALGKLSFILNVSRTEQPKKERVVVSEKSTKDAIAGRYREV